MSSDEKKYAEVGYNGVSILDEDIKDNFKNKKISASLVTGMFGCPAQWAVNRPLGEFLEVDMDNALVRGSWFHRIMEVFFSRPREERTYKNCLRDAKIVTAEEKDFQHLGGNREAKQWLKEAIDNYFEMGAKPENVRVATYQGKDGLECFVSGHIEGMNRDFLGFIDRLAVSSKGGVIIEDWKTGGKAKHYQKGNRYDEGWPEARQQILYSILLNLEYTSGKQNMFAHADDFNENNARNVIVDKARLIFPVAGEVVDVDIHDQELVDRAVADAIEAEKRYDSYLEENTFPYNPSFLCHWCPLAKVCPQATKRSGRVQKAMDAWDNQPEPEELEVGLVINPQND